MLSDERLEGIRRRRAAATAGPWQWVDPVTDEARLPLRDYDPLSLRTTWKRPTKSVGPLPVFIIARAEEIRCRADAEFIAHAREDVSVLLDEVEQMRKALAWYADTENYVEQDDEGVGEDGVPYRVVMRPRVISDDFGSRARAVLEGEDEA